VPDKQELQSTPEDPATESLVAVIRDKKKTDPLIGAKVAGKEILGRLLVAMKNERGVHSESLCCALGSLAGYACQASLRAQSIAKGLDPDAAFSVATTKDNQRFFFGDALNKLVVEDRYSVWSLSAGAAQYAGAKDLPDLADIFKHVAATVGTKAFGIPRYQTGQGAADPPINYVHALWPALLPVVKKMTEDPALWPHAYSFAIQEAIAAVKSALAPELALSIVMESAIPMSKADLGL
jgi:hypothetical protein